MLRLATPLCHDLNGFIDGELDEIGRIRFSEHLPDCPRCREEMPRLLALVDAVEHAGHASAPIFERDGARLPESKDESASRGGRRERETRRGPIGRARFRSRSLATGAAAAAVAFACWALVAWNAHRRERESAPLVQLGGSRPLEARLTYPPADGFRPYEPSRGVAGERDAVPFEALAARERKKDWRGIGVFRLLAGDLVD
jgi:anti-sigma factor RsiW